MRLFKSGVFLVSSVAFKKNSGPSCVPGNVAHGHKKITSFAPHTGLDDIVNCALPLPIVPLGIGRHTIDSSVIGYVVADLGDRGC